MNWKRVTGWTLAILTGLVLVAIVGGYFYLKSSGFRELAMRKIVASANQAMGGRTQIGSFDFDLSTLTAHLYNVVLHGTEAANAPPLARIDKLTVGLKIRSALRREVSLSQLLVDHPVLNLQVDRNGNSNIPKAPPSQSEGNTNVFDLAVGHAAITNGEIYYNDKKTPVDADLHNLQTDIRFEVLATRYRGSISYDQGQVRYGQYAPMPHRLTANFAVTPSSLTLDSAVITVGSSSATVRANLNDYSNPNLQGDYSIQLHAPDLAAATPTIKTAGDVSVSGTLQYQNKANEPFLRALRVDGRIGSEALSAASSIGRLELRELQGKFELAEGSLRTHDLAVETLGGRVNANLEIKNLDSTPSTRVQAALHKVSLQAAQQAVRNAKLEGIAVSGTLDGIADAVWTGPISNIRAKSDLTLRAATSSKQSASVIPVDGVIHANYDGPRGDLTLRQTTLRIPSTTLTANGRVSKHSSLEIHLTSSDLHQLAAMANAFRAAPGEQPLVSGAATLNATVQGSLQRPQIVGRLDVQNLGVQGSTWKTAGLSLQANPSRIIVSNGSLVNARRGSASFAATLSLRDWAYLPSNPIQGNLSLRQLSVADLQHLANVQYPLIGDLSGDLSFNGSQLDPSGSGTINITNARAYNEPIHTLELRFHTESSSIVSSLNVSTNAGAAKTDLVYTPKSKAYKLSLDAPSIVLQRLVSVQETNLAVNGTVSISANGRGTLDDPQLTAVLQLPELEVRQQSIAGLKAEVHVANKAADLTLDSQVAQASVRARSHVNLSGDYETDATIDTTSIPLDVVLATYTNQMPNGFKGRTEFHVTVKGPLKDKARMEAHLTVPTLEASYESLQIGAASPIHADYAHSVVTIQPAELRGTGTSVRIQGNVPLAGSAAPDLAVKGTIDARIARIISPDLKSSGTVLLDVRASGSASNPQVQGQVRLQNLAFVSAAAPLGVEKLNGTLDVNSGRVQISNMTGQVGGGQVSVGGSVTYRPSIQFDVALQGNSVRLRYPEGLRSVLDSNLTWTGNMQGSNLTGRVLIGALSFTPDFDLSTFGDQFNGNASTPAQPGFADTIGLHLAVQSKDNLTAASSQISLEGSADLRVIGTAANPIITGRTDLTSGELFYRNLRYELQRGIITFEDPNRTEPVLNVSVTTKVEQYNLTLNLRGPLDSLTTSYVSDPPLATADVINLIARGKTSSELAASSQSTDSMIASQAAGEVSGSVQKLAGLSSLQIDPLLGGNNQNPSARLAMQQRVTKNFLFTFSTDVSQPGNELVQGEYQINKRWSVSVARDQLGGVSMDGRFHTRF